MIGSGLLAASGGRSAIDPHTMRRPASVDARFQSYNVEMAEVIGGNFWKPYDQADRATAAAPPSAVDAGACAGAPAGLDPSLFQARPADRSGERAAAQARGSARPGLHARERHVGEHGVFPRRRHTAAREPP